MDLGAAVQKYIEVAGSFDQQVHLSAFGLPKEEIEKIVSAWDEDYQISRYLLLSLERNEALASFPPESRIYLINGYECSHLTFHADIQKLL